MEIHKINDWLRDHGQTVLMTVKEATDNRAVAYHEFLQYMADCVIHLDQRVTDQVTTRRIRIGKYRGSAYGRNEYPFAITAKGVRIIPITQANLRHRALGETISSGIAGLDEILGGGYRRASCTLITGGSGTGKTTFACSFARSATSQGEKVLYLDYEESWDAMVSSMLSPGIDLRPAMKTGQLCFVSTMPESQGIEEHLIQAFDAIEDFQPGFLVLDALSACRRMGSEQAAFDYLLRLIDHCKTRGITTLLTNLTATAGNGELTGIDLSSVIDTVIIVRNIERNGGFRRELAILKSRGRHHSNRVHEFRITTRGVEIPEAQEGRHDG